MRRRMYSNNNKNCLEGQKKEWKDGLTSNLIYPFLQLQGINKKIGKKFGRFWYLARFLMSEKYQKLKDLKYLVKLKLSV